MEILMWFCIGVLTGLAILFWVFVVGLVIYIIFSVAFALFDALGIKNPFVIIWDMIKGLGV